MEESMKGRNWGAWQPERVLAKLWWRIGTNSRLAFCSALILGFVTHIYMFVNKLPNGDDLESAYRDYAMTASGRWFDQIAMAASSWYSIPWTTGVAALFFLALSAGLLSSLFAIKNKASVVILAALLTTFPVLAAQFSYLFYADLYMIAMCLSVGAIWLAKRGYWGVIPGTVAIACAMGCYQAYIGFAVVVCMLSLMAEVLRGESMAAVLKLALRYLLCGALGVALYFVILQQALAASGEVLTDYQGINDMGRLPKLQEVLPLIYQEFAAYFFAGTYFKTPLFGQVLYGIVLVLAVAAVGYGVIRRRLWRKPTLLILLLMGGLLPVGYNLIYLMAPEATLHCLMLPQYALFMLMPVIFYENAFTGQVPSLWSVGGKWILLAASVLIAYQFYLTCNLCYYHLELRYEITYATQLRLLDRLEQLEGYDESTPVAIIGTFPNAHMSQYPLASYDRVAGLTGIRGNLVHHDKNYRGFYRDYLGKQLNVLSEEESAAYAAFAAEMPSWPENGSVVMVDGTAVVHIR